MTDEPFDSPDGFLLRFGPTTFLWRSLQSGGRFVAEFGGHGNVAAIQTAVIAVLKTRGIDGASRSPWYFPTAQEYRSKLEMNGFIVEKIAVIPRPTPLPTCMHTWLETFANPFLEGIEGANRSRNSRGTRNEETILIYLDFGIGV